MKFLALLILIICFYVAKAIIVGILEGGKVLLKGVNEAEKHLLNRNNLQYDMLQPPAVQPNSLLLSSTKTTPNTKYSIYAYNELAQKHLSNTTLNNKSIKNIAANDIDIGRTPEEALLHSYTIEVALTANETLLKPNIFEMINLTTSVMPMLKIFKEWKDERRIDQWIWTEMTNLIYHVSTISPQQNNAINRALEGLRCLESDLTFPTNETIYSKNTKAKYLNPSYKIYEILKVQFNKIRENEQVSAKLHCEFILGYVVGFSDYFLQNWNEKNGFPNSIEVSTEETAAVYIVFVRLYGQELGSTLFGKCLRELEGKNDEFYNGKLVGNKDFLSLSNRNIAPTGLEEYIEE